MESVTPPSITSKGLATHGSVWEHAFGQGDPYTLGVWEVVKCESTLDEVRVCIA